VLTAALLDRQVHSSHILLLEDESFRLRKTLEQQAPAPAVP
jgi:hypothetical protein